MADSSAACDPTTLSTVLDKEDGNGTPMNTFPTTGSAGAAARRLNGRHDHPSSPAAHAVHAAHAARRAIAGVALGATAAIASAGDILPPPGSTHDWTGAVNDSWHVAGNWSAGSVPGTSDAVIILGGPFNNVLLGSDTAAISSLFIGNARSVSNHGSVLDVTAGADSTTTVVGTDSSLFLVPIPGGGPGFLTDELTLDDDARLSMAGGRARVHAQLTLLDDARITGHGRIDVISSAPAALNAANGGPMNVSGGDLRIDVNTGGTMAMPPEIHFGDADRTLTLNAPIIPVVPVTLVDLGAGGVIDSAAPWGILGALHADSSGTRDARIEGARVFLAGDIDVANGGGLRFDAPLTLQGTGSTTVRVNARLELAGDGSEVNGTHHTLVSNGGRLLVDFVQTAGAWDGDLQLAPGGVLELAPSATGGWSLDGDLTMNGFAALRSRIEGPTALRARGQVDLTGSGGEVAGAMELWTGASMVLPGPATRLVTSGLVRLRGGSETTGGGGIDVLDGGTLVVEPTADVHVPIQNDGDLVVGSTLETEYVYLHGSLTMGPTARLTVAMDGPTSFDRDTVETAGATQLGGTLHVQLLDGYVPAIGETFEVLWANGGLSGAFEAVTGAPGFAVSQSGTTVTLTFEGEGTCGADLSGDGVVDLGDLLMVLAAWGDCEGCSVDLDGDGQVGIGDLLIVLAAWGDCV